MAFPVLCSDPKNTRFPIDFKLLNYLLVIYLFSELINIFLKPFLGFSANDYLSYTSTKSLVVLPSFYYLLKKNFKIALPIILLTVIVLIGYSTRMIILTYTISLLIIFFASIRISLKHIFAFALVVFVIILFSNSLELDFESFKATGVFIQLFADGELFEKFLLIDPVRYYETKMFFERSFFSIFFGDGFGSGLIDKQNYLHFVKVTDSAFSAEELNSRRYYNLHDTWIDLGLRFGLVSIMFSYFYIFRWIYFRKNLVVQISAALLIVLFSCITYSTQGLLILSFIFYFAKVEYFNSKRVLSGEDV